MVVDSIDHVNLVVRDLEAMLQFYTQVLGLQVTKRVRIQGPWVEEISGLTGASAEVVYLGVEHSPCLELIRYDHPKTFRPSGLEMPNTPGIRHLAFRVTDIHRIVAAIQAAGVTLSSKVQQVPETQAKYPGGTRKHLVYFQDPEGNLLELCEYRLMAECKGASRSRDSQPDA